MNASAAAPRRDVSFWSVLFGLVAIGWVVFFLLNPTYLNKVGVGHLRAVIAPEKFHDLWFIDTYAILAANDALSAGLDPYKPNPLDYLGRPHVYGPLWLHLRCFGLGREDSLLLGFILVASFMAAAVAVLRPQTAGSFLWSVAIFCTTPVLLGMERANNDLLVFLILMPLVPCLLSGHVILRWISVPLLLFAAALKYYPLLAGLLLLAPAPSAETRWRIAVTGIGAALVGWNVVATVPRLDLIPAPLGMFTFGATAPFRLLGMKGWTPQIIVGALALIVFAMWWRSSLLSKWNIDESLRRQWMYHILGSVLLAGCFFADQNYAYRWVFSIWLAPFLWTILRSTDCAPGVFRLARLAAALLISVLWFEAAFVFALHRLPDEGAKRAAAWMYWIMQPLIWVFIICILGFLAKFTRDAWANIRPACWYIRTRETRP